MRVDGQVQEEKLVQAMAQRLEGLLADYGRRLK